MTLHLEDHNTLATLKDATLDHITWHSLIAQLTDPFPVLLSCFRVLQPGGILAIQDGLNSDYPRAAEYIDTLHRMIDPSHQHFPADYEWRGVLLDSGFEIITFQTRKKIQNVPETPNRDKVALLLHLVPERVRQLLSPLDADKLTFTFQEVHIIGKKPD